MPPPTITEGTGYVLFAYDVAHAFDLAAAETRLASATQRQTVKQKRRAPAFFEYDPAPLRVTEPADSLAVGEHVTAPYVEFVLYDFGAVSVSYAIPLQGPLTGLPALSTILYGNEQLQADSRRRVRSEEHTSELQSHSDLVCRLLLEKKKQKKQHESMKQKKKPKTH